MTLYNQDQIQAIASRIKGIPFGMFTTIDDASVLSSRPLTTQELDKEGNLWFFTTDDAQFVHEMERHPTVNVSYSDTGHDLYVSITGEAHLVKDRDRARVLWKPAFRAWFPRGLDDPHLALIRLHIQTAEYWDANTRGMKQLLTMAKTALTGRRPNGMGEHTTICL